MAPCFALNWEGETWGGGKEGEIGRGDRKGKRGKRRYAYVRTSTVEILDDS